MDIHIKRERYSNPPSTRYGRHQSPPKNTCLHCQRRFMNKHALYKHRLSLHTHVCESCESVHPTCEDLDKHLIQCSDRRTCVECRILFYDDSALEQHQYQEHESTFSSDESTPPAFCCHGCEKMFGSEEGLKKHEETSRQPTRCTPCEKRFINHISLLWHLRNSSCHQSSTDCSISDELPLENGWEQVTTGLGRHNDGQGSYHSGNLLLDMVCYGHNSTDWL
jgi:hypothetical protein